MKQVMTLLVRDEEDVVASNIDFHLNKGVDFIIAMDNLSFDGATDILRLYERKGMLHYLNQPDDTYAQGIWVTQMARLAFVQFSADWIINNDVDEFWWPEQGDLKSILASIDPSCPAVAVERTNFIPRPIPAGEFFADYLTIRERRSLNVLGAPLPGKVCHRGLPDIEVEYGNHRVTATAGLCPRRPRQSPFCISRCGPTGSLPTRLPKAAPPLLATRIFHRRSGEPGGNSTRSGGVASSRLTIRR